jgi:hypothetical protein
MHRYRSVTPRERSKNNDTTSMIIYSGPVGNGTTGKPTLSVERPLVEGWSVDKPGRPEGSAADPG